MVSTSNMLRTCGLLLYLTFQVHASAVKTPDLILQSLKVGSVTCDNNICKYLLNVSGVEFLGHYPWRLTPEKGAKGGSCEIIYPNYEIKEIETSKFFSKIEVLVPNIDSKIYFCLQRKVNNKPFGYEWVHQGLEHFLEPKNDHDSEERKGELSITTEPETNASQEQKIETQTKQTLESETQEHSTVWADLIHDTDVNYLPGVSRPTREERNEIEVLFHQKYVPLNDLIEQLKIDSKETVDILNSNRAYNVDINVKRDVIKNNVREILQDDHVREASDKDRTLNRINVNNIEETSKYLKTARKYDVKMMFDKTDALVSMLQASNFDKKMAEIKSIMNKMNVFPIYKTLQDIAMTCFPNDECIQKVLLAPRLSSKSIPESLQVKWQDVSKQRNDADISTSNKDIRLGSATDKFDKLEHLMSIVQSNNIETKIANIKEIADKMNLYPVYTALQEIAARCFPNNECMQKIMAAPLSNSNKSEISLEENVKSGRKQPNEEETLISSNNVKLNRDIDEFKKELEALMSMVQSNKIETKIVEITETMEKIYQFPIYTTLQQIATQCFPNDECIQRMIATSFNSKSSATSEKELFHNIELRNELETANARSDINYKNELNIESEKLLKSPFQELAPKLRKRRQLAFDDFTSVKAGSQMVLIEGVRIENSDKEPKIIEDGIPSVLAESAVTLRLYGDGLTPRTVIAFTHDQQPYGQPCKFLLKGEYMVKQDYLKPRTALFAIQTPAPITGSKLYICAKNLQPGVTDPNKDDGKYFHQGTETWKMLASHNKLLPLWVSISLILICLLFSALFSGLNLGLMSLDRTELKIIANTGTEQEKKYARAIMPVRDHGNYLLCSILLGNVAVNSTFTILLDELTSGLFAVIFSTFAIVLLGEITPQAICSRHGLMVGAKSIVVTKGVMAVTAPLSYPVSKLLDYFLGEEIGNVYNRERLKELVKVTTDVNDLDKDEVNIISGALEMRKKMVRDVMTKLEDVFMLPISSVLDFETMSEIVKSGYSRIPVYEGSRGNIVTVLFIKDLAFVDPDDNTPLQTLCQYYQNPAHFVFEDVTLDIMFKQFKDGHKGHMAFVHRINNEGEGDPFYETIGLVTLEDVIEEMIQSEIVDETDVFLDNRSKRRRRPQNKLQDFAAFAERHENQRIHISPQLTLATFQFLSTSVDAFRPDMVSETVLRRLLRQDVIQYIKIKGKTNKDPTTFVFQQGKPVDYFLLILEGRVEVTVGRENLVFEAGPFTYFGVQALTQNVGVAESPTPSAMGSLQNINMEAMLRHTFVPDYSVRAITSLYYLTVKRSLYLAAKRATLMEKGNISKGGTTQEFDTEVDKNLCNSSSANIVISVIAKKLLGKASNGSSKDEGPSSSGVKPSARVNIIELMQVTQNTYPSSEKMDVTDNKRVANSMSGTDLELLQSVDEDLSITGEHKTPSRQVSPNPMPVSPAARAVDSRNGHPYLPATTDEQERLLK